MITIRTYTEADAEAVIDLVLHCQNDGTRPPVTIDDQPELLHIREHYLKNGGSFWVATDEEKIVGSIALMNCGNGIAVLKKFFVEESYRGRPFHLGRRLYTVLLDFAQEQGIKRLLLDTPKNTERAHRFYKKAGFQKIEENQLPVVYDYPYENSDFFSLEL
ncbi:GNAT family N-acetyltransferase [Qiania dongpingensis]|uniref:GNAT family N-acetyltransferase n=1 Tax=Qiania dongpingensis TaxID=2763669 RepID=A0A7G9G2J9_9FIRM|nr:GNAT family N-acetyltransferase [Qiania dongpingensis]QNM05031.1 GNAT family N-acetyltransferase [Qiania dongpingensis]